LSLGLLAPARPSGDLKILSDKVSKFRRWLHVCQDLATTFGTDTKQSHVTWLMFSYSYINSNFEAEANLTSTSKRHLCRHPSLGLSRALQRCPESSGDNLSGLLRISLVRFRDGSLGWTRSRDLRSKNGFS
ncbi:hypothetical protein RSAG8_01956, partial [Rhizoctonia solani AG-8 WAC10335]